MTRQDYAQRQRQRERFQDPGNLSKRSKHPVADIRSVSHSQLRFQLLNTTPTHTPKHVHTICPSRTQRSAWKLRHTDRHALSSSKPLPIPSRPTIADSSPLSPSSTASTRRSSPSSSCAYWTSRSIASRCVHDHVAHKKKSCRIWSIILSSKERRPT